MIVGWRASISLRSDLALDALKQALYDRPLIQAEPLVHHSDRACSTCRSGTRNGWPRPASSRRSAARGLVRHALAETVIGLFKTEEIRRRGPWKGFEDVEFATLKWVAWYNSSRLLEMFRYVPLAESETAYHDRQTAPVGMAVLT